MKTEDIHASASLTSQVKQAIQKAIEDTLNQVDNGFGEFEHKFNISGIVNSHVTLRPGTMHIKNITTAGTLNCLVHARCIVIEGFLVAQGGKSVAQTILKRFMVTQKAIKKAKAKRARKAKAKKQPLGAPTDYMKVWAEQKEREQQRTPAVIERAQNTIDKLVNERSRLETLRSRFSDLLSKAAPASDEQARRRREMDVLSADIKTIGENIKAQEKIIQGTFSRRSR